MALLELQNLGMGYGEGEFLFRHVTFAFPSCGVFVLLGSSGSGKSSLLHLLSNNLSPKEGRVLYQGKDLAKMNEKERSYFHGKEIGMLFQHYELLEGESAERNVALPLLFSGEKESKALEKAKEALESIGLKEKASINVSLLSGGERQRVGFCRALIANPRILFADEPTGALDQENGAKVIETLLEEGKKRLVIIATHDEAIAEKLRDSTLRIEGGDIRLPLVVSNTEPEKGATKKEKSRVRGKGLILWRQLHQDKVSALFGVGASMVAFSCALLSLGFLLHAESSLEETIRQSPGYGYAEVRKKEEIALEGSPLTLVKESRASKEEASALLGDEGFCFANDLSAFFPSRPAFSLHGEFHPTCLFVPILSNSLLNDSDIQEVAINSKFQEAYDVSLGESLTVPLSFSFSYRGVKEEVSEEWIFCVTEIIEDFSFLGEPRVYYSYVQATNALRSIPLPRISSSFPSTGDLLELVDASGTDSPYLGEATLIFAETEEAEHKLEEVLKKETLEGYSFSSPLFLQRNAFMELYRGFSSALVLFLGVSLLSLVALLGMNGLACFERHRRDCALYRVLGLQEKEVSSLFVNESVLISLTGLLFAFLFTPVIGKGLNRVFDANFGVPSLIELPLLSAYGIPFFWVILFVAFAILLSLISTRIPLRFAGKRPYIEELKDE